MAMVDLSREPATKADIQLLKEKLEDSIDTLEEKLEAKIDGIKAWITGIAFVTGVAVLLSLASINISLFRVLN